MDRGDFFRGRTLNRVRARRVANRSPCAIYFLFALGSPVGDGAWAAAACGPSSSVKMGFSASAQTWQPFSVG